MASALPQAPPLWSPRQPTLSDLPGLTALALAAKGHWGYPQAWLDLWFDELAYVPRRLESERHIVAEARDGALLGIVSFSQFEGDTWEIEGLWIHPQTMGMGIGRGLMSLAMDELASKGCLHLRIVSDPGAQGFYERLGAREIGAVPSRPKGRSLPLLALNLKDFKAGKSL